MKYAVNSTLKCVHIYIYTSKRQLKEEKSRRYGSLEQSNELTNTRCSPRHEGSFLSSSKLEDFLSSLRSHRVQ